MRTQDNKTPFPNLDTIDKKWYIIDATDQRLGRLASEIAKILRGKNKPTFTPHLDTGDFVIVINAEKVVVTGKKREQKLYRRDSGRPGGMKVETFDKLQARLPERIIEKAVQGMLPKNTLGRKLFTKLKVYAGGSHPHQAQKPQDLELFQNQVIEAEELSFISTLSESTSGTREKPLSQIGYKSLKTITKTMAVIRNKKEDGYFKLTLHSSLLDVAGQSDKSVDISLVEKTDKTKYSHEELADRYLKEVLHLNFDALPLSYQFQSFEKGNINFTQTWIAKFHQYYQGVPVYGTIATVEIDQKNKDLLMISSTLGDLSSDPNFSKPNSEISLKQVEGILEKEIGSDENLDLNPQLYWYYNSSESRWKLTYIVEGICKDTTEDEDDIPEIFDYVIDADGGEIIDAIPRTQ